MTNAEKFKTAQERAEAFEWFCIPREVCDGCELDCDKAEKPSYCQFAWLDLEADEKKRSFCFYCKHQSVNITKQENGYVAKCDCCDYTSRAYDSVREAIAAHNRVAKAVLAANEGGAK